MNGFFAALFQLRSDLALAVPEPSVATTAAATAAAAGDLPCASAACASRRRGEREPTTNPVAPARGTCQRGVNLDRGHGSALFERVLAGEADVLVGRHVRFTIGASRERGNPKVRGCSSSP